MRTIYQTISNVGPTDVNVMINGESGTGKELVAKALHETSLRNDKPFVALNMAAIPAELVESYLFGHERGAFTGANMRRQGACEEANGGTLFLDEITEMPIELQSKLLRFLQERVIRRVGGSEDIHLDVRILSATNRDPLLEVNEGRLRSDLYYRLNVVPIHLAPLRERSGDIRLIAKRLIPQISQKHGRNFKDIEIDALLQLEQEPWPGNIRQLIHTLERVIVMNHGDTITKNMLQKETVKAASPTHLDHSSASKPEPQTSPPSNHPRNVDEIIPMIQLEQQAIENAMRVLNGSVSQVAARLKLSEATVYRRLKEYRESHSRA
jgi:two-component system repressor protein LuxO